MNFDELTIGEARKVAALFCGEKASSQHGAVGRKCVVRTYASGVHFGEVASVESNEGRSRCKMLNSQRIWSWDGAFTLSGVAMYGIKEGKLSCVVPEHFIEDAIEFIPMKADAINCLEGMKIYEP